MIFSRLFYRKRSGKVARERLQILLVTDRLGCNPDTTEAIKNDIIKVIYINDNWGDFVDEWKF